MSNYRKLLELAHTTTQIALDHSQMTPAWDWERLTEERYAGIQREVSVIHEALVVILRSLEPILTLRMGGCNDLPDLDLDPIYADPRGELTQMWLIRNYLGNWRYSTASGEESKAKAVSIDDLTE